MGANIAGIYGAQIFRSEDKPRYRRAFGINIAVLTVGLSLAVVRYIDDRIRRRRHPKQLGESGSDYNSNEDEKIAAPRPSDVQPQTVLFEPGLKPVAVDPAVKL